MLLLKIPVIPQSFPTGNYTTKMCVLVENISGKYNKVNNRHYLHTKFQ